jgi:peptide/nickel transport system permease protein
VPGDPVRLIFPRGAEPETLEKFRHLLGYDKSMWDQYVNSIVRTLQFNFGTSARIVPNAPINDLLIPYTLRTVFVIGIATALCAWVGQIWGSKSAWKKGSLFDTVSSNVTVVFYSIPIFLYAILFLMMFSMFFPHWPLTGSQSPWFNELDIIGQILDIIQHATLPLIVCVVGGVAGFSLIVRSSLLDVLQEDYIVTAEAKGLAPEDVRKKHAMPNARLPIVANIAMSVGWIIGGEVMIEYIFTYKGLGYLSWVAVITLDFPVLEATFYVLTVSVLVANFISDILNFYLDPRVRI